VSNAGNGLLLRGRYYKTIPMDQARYETETLELDPGRTALVAMHCWNIGCPDGPPVDMSYFVGMGFPQTTAEAARIMRQAIAPAMDAARRAGVAVCHIESELITAKHPEAQQDIDPPVRISGGYSAGPAVPGWRDRMAERFHGREYMSRSPLARMDRAEAVAPLPGEIYAFQTGQFDRALRRRGIENLIYCGFCTDMCVLRAPGGIEPMAGLGYRLFLMRDATLGCELPDTFDERIATRWAIAYFETHFGDTVLLADFLEACGRLAGEQ
jgi:nicotinamidase-related amidase